jgi:hypothetical protein
MKTYPIFRKDGIREPIFEIENIYIASGAIVRLLAGVEGVTEVRPRKMFSKPRDIHVEFNYLRRPYVVWEPMGDNSRFWIGPADIVSGVGPVPPLDRQNDIFVLEDAFKRYRPPLHRAILGDVLTLQCLRKLVGLDRNPPSA